MEAAQQNPGGGKREEEEDEEDLSLVYAARGQQTILHYGSASLLLMGLQKFGFPEFKFDFETKKIVDFCDWATKKNKKIYQTVLSDETCLNTNNCLYRIKDFCRLCRV